MNWFPHGYYNVLLSFIVSNAIATRLCVNHKPKLPLKFHIAGLVWWARDQVTHYSLQEQTKTYWGREKKLRATCPEGKLELKFFFQTLDSDKIVPLVGSNIRLYKLYAL